MLIVNALTCVNLGALFCLLYFRKNNPLPNKILAFLFLIPALFCVDSMFVLTGTVYKVPYFFFFVQIIAILFPLLVYIYVNLLLGENPKLNAILTSGSALLAIYIVALTIKFGLMPSANKLDYIDALDDNNYPPDMLWYTILFYAWQMVYFSVSTYKVYRYSRSIDNSLSNTDQVKILYLKRFVTLIWILNLALVVMYVGLPIYYVDYLLLPVFVNITYFFILYFSYHYNAIFTDVSFKQLTLTNSIVDQSAPPADNTNTILAITDKHQKVYEALQHIIEQQNVYRNPDLTLPALAEKLNAPAYLVSQTINHYYKKSFFDLINELRINEATQLLKQMNATQTIEGIAYETGFNSRASFYRAYKKYTGHTPTDTIAVSKQ